MSLRSKAIVLATIVTVVVMAVIYAVSTKIILGGFTNLEAQTTERLVENSVSILSDQSAYLRSKALDWGEWDDTYNFVVGRDPVYIQANMTDESFANLDINLIVITDSQGNVIFAKSFDLLSGMQGGWPAFFSGKIQANSPLFSNNQIGQVTSGFISLPEGVMLVSSSPITDSARQKPPAGHILLGNYLNSYQAAKIGRQLGEQVFIYRVDSGVLPADVQNALINMSDGHQIYIGAAGGESISGYALLTDVNGVPAAVLKVQRPTIIIQQGRVTLLYYLIAGCASAALLMILGVLALDRVVLRKIAALNSGVKKISGLSDHSLRLRVEGSDEIASLEAEINKMLENLHASYDQLQEQQNIYRMLTDNVSDIVWTMDMNFRVTYISPSATRARGYTLEELQSLPLEQQMPPESLQNAMGAFLKALEQEQKQPGSVATREVEMELSCKDGSTILSENVVAFLRDGSGKPVGMIGVARDITERKHAEQRQMIDQKLESIGVLAGGIAHDFNNILAAILGNISLARMSVESGSEAMEQLSVAEKACVRAKDLTNQLLTFARGGAPVKAARSLVELLHTAVNFALSGSNVRCEFSIQEDLWPAEIDEGQISQVIHNLVVNACQSMPEGGIVWTGAENVVLDGSNKLALAGGKYVRLSIRDEGHGISKAHLKNIFDPYFTTKRKGTGLGLATTYSIIKNHAGEITVESTVGVGSTFSVYLPASEKPVHVCRAEKEELALPEGKKVMLVDDEEMIRDATGRMLKRLGVEIVLLAADGAEAIQLFREALSSDKPVDAVIMDLTIPGGMGGKDAVGELLKLDPRASVIVSSGYASDPIMSKYKKYGFKGVLAKPYKMQELSKVLKDVMTEAKPV